MPPAWTEPTLPDHARMRRREDGGCIALEGTAGEATACRIYDARPTPCRAFEPSTAQQVNPYCDAAREQVGLPPLRT